MKKFLASVLTGCLLASALAVGANAATLPAGDVSGDGKVTPFDALKVQGHLHGEITLSEEEIARALASYTTVTTLSTAHITAIFNRSLCPPVSTRVTIPNDSEESEATLRERVYNRMYEMATISWSNVNACSYRDSDCDLVVKANQQWVGMLYGHESASLARMKSVLSPGNVNENQYASYATGAGNITAIPTDVTVMGNYFSNDCSSSVCWAWQTVSNTTTWTRCRSLTPYNGNEQYGAVKVGNYYTPSNTNKTVWHNESNNVWASVVSNSDGTVNADRLTALYEAYAQCKKGDAIVYMGTDGHARMVCNVHVEKESGTTINPEDSYIECIECGGADKKTYWNTDYPFDNSSVFSKWKFQTYTFEELAAISKVANPASAEYKVYVPVTCAELANGTRDEAYVDYNSASRSPFGAIVSSNYRVVATTLSISKDGEQVGEDTSYTGEYGRITTAVEYEGLDDSGYTSYEDACKQVGTTTPWETSRLTYKSVNLQKHASAFSLTDGESYSYTITVLLSTDDTATFTGTFTYHA